MLIEFSVGNYRSFKDTVTFSMVAAKITAKDKSLDENNVFRIDDNLSLLKSAAIYGANASGKSNFISALSFMVKFTRNSSKDTQADELIDVERFSLSTEKVNKPSFFELVFLLEGKKYRYGFEVTPKKVIAEWLFHTPTTKEAKLFTRDESGISFSTAFKEGKGIVERTRDNALFLSVVAQFNGGIAKKILGWIALLGIVSNLIDRGDRSYTLEHFEGNEAKLAIIKFIKKLDLNIDDIQLETVTTSVPPTLKEIAKRIYIKTWHKQYDSNDRHISTIIFDLDKNESEGTKKLFLLAGILIDVLTLGGIPLVIDELDARLHPLITRAIIQLFNSNESNTHNAQLIFTTHDINLLSNTIFRRDQIWFAEKNKLGATDLYSLAEFKVRNDASYEKDYIQGKYGAIPFIGDIQHLIGKANGK